MERIKWNILIGDIVKGGLFIVDIDCKLKLLKVVWILRLFNLKGILFDIFSN